MSESVKEKLMRWFTISMLLVIVVVGLVTAYPQYCNSRSLKQREADLQAQIEAKQKEIAKLIENQRRFSSDADFVESIARQNRRVFPGELVFVFED